MRKMIIFVLLFCILIGGCSYVYATDIAPNYLANSMEEYDHIFNTYAPQTIRCGFISAYELSPILGRLDHFVSYAGDLSRYLYSFSLPQATGGYYCRIGVTIEHQWDGYLEDHYMDWPVLDMSCVNGSMDKLMPEYQEQINGNTEKYIIRRDVFVYRYHGGGLRYIEWENNGIIISLDASGLDYSPLYSTEYYTGTIIEKLLSINEEAFQEAKAQLLTIGYDRKHPYSDKWNWGKEGHWHECKCGAREEVFAHIDEDQNNRCDICPYEIPKSSNRPVIKPAQTDDSSTRPTAQPTTAPATEPAPIRQAEPPAPPAALWIGIGAACVVAAVALILLLKKKKR